MFHRNIKFIDMHGCDYVAFSVVSTWKVCVYRWNSYALSCAELAEVAAECYESRSSYRSAQVSGIYTTISQIIGFDRLILKPDWII